MFVCLCLCVYVYMCVYMAACVCISLCQRVYTYLCALQGCVCLFLFLCSYAHDSAAGLEHFQPKVNFFFFVAVFFSFLVHTIAHPCMPISFSRSLAIPPLSPTQH